MENIIDKFESEYAKIEYIEKDNVVFHVWKKEAHFDNYREPVSSALEMLRAHKGSSFIVDARNGFEDVKEDVEWGFTYFLPELKRTGCIIWGFMQYNRFKPYVGIQYDYPFRADICNSWCSNTQFTDT